MIARLLHVCGFYLGEDDDIFRVGPDNPDGFWEHRRFVDLNNLLLTRLGGGWDKIPPLEPGWESRGDLAILNRRAEDLIGEFAGYEYWGWKDPRSSLTIPFWKKHLPGLKTLICVRSPVEVAQSLTRRGFTSDRFGFDLWQAYNQILLDTTALGDRLVTHYESYFEDPKAELRRVLDFIAMDVPESVIDDACETVVASRLRHNRSRTDMLVEARLPSEAFALYQKLCADAGPVYEQVQREAEGDLPPSSAEDGPVYEDFLRARLEYVEARLAAQSTELKTQQAHEGIIARQKADIQKQSETIHLQELTLKEQEATIRRQAGALDLLSQQLGRVLGSGTWRAGLAVRRTRDMLLGRRRTQAVIGQLGPTEILETPADVAGAGRLKALAGLRSIVDLNRDAKGIVIFPPAQNWFTEHYQRTHQMAAAFARLGYLVFYMQNEKADALYVAGFRQVKERLYLSDVPPETFGVIRSPLVMIYTFNAEWLSFFESPVIVYDLFDDLSVYAAGSPEAELQQVHAHLLETADAVLGASDKLVAQLHAVRADAILVPNAADYAHFAREEGQAVMPPDLAAVVGKGDAIVGYSGALARWVDYGLIKQAASALPDSQFVLIGGRFDDSALTAGLDDLPNIHWLDRKLYPALPDYVGAFQVGIIPFKVNPATEAASPIKLYEYMAAGIPVVATDLPECRKYPGVLVAPDTETFIEQIRQGLTLYKDSAARAGLQQTARENTWEMRAAQILAAARFVKESN